MDGGAIAELISAGVTVVGVIYTAGAVVGRIKNQELALKDHHDRLGDHDVTLGEHAVAIARGESWRAGYSAGKTDAR